MSDVMIFDFNFEGVYQIDEPQFTPIVDFGQFQLAARRKVTLWQKGSELVIPEIQVDGKAWSRKGMKEGGKTEAVFFTRIGEKQDGSQFTEVRIFTTNANIPIDADKIDKFPVIALGPSQLEQKDAGDTVWISDLSNLVIPAVKAQPEISGMIGSGKSFYGSAKNWNTGKKPNIVNEGEDNEKKYYERFWYDFVVYSSKEAMIAARDAHFAGLNSEDKKTTYPVTPVDWTGNEETMLAWVKSELASGKDLKATAATAGLVPEAKDKTGNTVDYKSILSGILGVPVPMVQV